MTREDLKGLRYSQAVDNEVFDFLEREGYKVSRDRTGVSDIQKQLKAENKSILIKTKNQKMEETNEGLKYTFELSIEFKETGGE